MKGNFHIEDFPPIFQWTHDYWEEEVHPKELTCKGIKFNRSSIYIYTPYMEHMGFIYTYLESKWPIFSPFIEVVPFPFFLLKAETPADVAVGFWLQLLEEPKNRSKNPSLGAFRFVSVVVFVWKGKKTWGQIQQTFPEDPWDDCIFTVHEFWWFFMVNVGIDIAYMASYMGFNGKKHISGASRRFLGVRKCLGKTIFLLKSPDLWCGVSKNKWSVFGAVKMREKSNSFSKTAGDKFPIWHFQFDMSYRQKSTWKNPTPKTASMVEVRLMKENALSMSDLDPDGTGTSSITHHNEFWSILNLLLMYDKEIFNKYLV